MTPPKANAPDCSEPELYEQWRRGDITYREYSDRLARTFGESWWSRFWRYFASGCP